MRASEAAIESRAYLESLETLLVFLSLNLGLLASLVEVEARDAEWNSPEGLTVLALPTQEGLLVRENGTHHRLVLLVLPVGVEVSLSLRRRSGLRPTADGELLG